MNLETGRLEGVGKQLIIVEVPRSRVRDNKATLLYQHDIHIVHMEACMCVCVCVCERALSVAGAGFICGLWCMCVCGANFTSFPLLYQIHVVVVLGGRYSFELSRSTPYIACSVECAENCR
jgi:hypothetical protein